jgi:sensor histidine kinase regulating citrate/malate metabolism
LLVRIMVNMVKNALEATPEGGAVKAWVKHGSAGCELRVWNAGTIAHDVAIQVFKRSFSTKSGRGRGLGTFSMKLFGERYLGGAVGFTSTEDEVTTFFIRLPTGQFLSSGDCPPATD